MKKQKTMFLVLGFIIIAAGAFFGGMKFQEGKQTADISNYQSPFNRFTTRQTNNSQRTNDGQQLPGQGSMMRNNGNSGFRPVNGDIINADDKSITVKMTDGSSKIIFFSDKTTINKSTVASTADLKTGEKVMVIGQQNADGSVTATNINLNPVIRNNAQLSPAAPNK